MAPELDPEIADWLRAYPAPDVDPYDVAAIRGLAGQYMADRGGPAPRWPRDDVTLTAADVGGVPVLVWAPRNSDESNPVVVALHGGAFIVGSALGAERIAVPLAADHDIVTVSVEYRLAPENPAPAAFDDVVQVLTALDEIEGIDTSRVAVHGSSAGGAIAASVAIWARDSGFDLRLQSLSCPALDHRAGAPSNSMDGYSPTLRLEEVKAMWGHYLAGGPVHPYVVPAMVDSLAGVAPAHITVAEYDVLRDEAMEYAERMRRDGVAVDLDLVAGSVHGFDGLLAESTIATAAIGRQVAAMAAALMND